MSATTRRLGTALAAAAALATVIPAAFAVSTFTVTAGSAATGTTVAITAVSAGATPQLRLTIGNLTLTCDSGTMPGNATVGTGLSGTNIAAINGPNTTWTNCQGGGFTFTVTASGLWSFNAISGSSAGASGNVSGVSLTATGTGSFGSTCDFTVTGSVPASYDNATTTLTIYGGGLTASGVGGTCEALGVIHNGDAASLRASYGIAANNSAYNPIHITQP